MKQDKICVAKENSFLEKLQTFHYIEPKTDYGKQVTEN